MRASAFSVVITFVFQIVVAGGVLATNGTCALSLMQFKTALKPTFTPLEEDSAQTEEVINEKGVEVVESVLQPVLESKVGVSFKIGPHRAAEVVAALKGVEEKKDVTCRFQLLIDDIDVGKPTGDILQYASCITDEMETYYLLMDHTTHDILLPGDKVTLTLEEVTHRIARGGAKPPWATQNTTLYKVVAARSSKNPTVALLGGSKQTKEMLVLTIICKYRDFAPNYITERQAELDLFATPTDVAAGEFHGSMADMIKIASYGKVTLPRSKAKTVTVHMGSWWMLKKGKCDVDDIAKEALQKLKEQHPLIDANKFTTREFFIPQWPAGGCIFWGGRGQLGCGHPSILPNLGGCFAWYRVGGPFIRAHELGHNLGLMHAGGEAGWQGFVEYGDQAAAMGSSFRFSSFIASSRHFLGFLEEGMVDWSKGAAKSLALGPTSLPLGQPGAEAVAIRMQCPRCVPKVPEHAHNKGGYVWVSFRGDEGYSAIQNRGLEERFQNKVYVHLARKFSNPRHNEGSELWKVLNVGESYRPENLQHTIYVCSIIEDLATVSVGSNTADASSKCLTLKPLSIRWEKDPSKCLDVNGGANRDGANIHLWDCAADDKENRQFLMPSSGTGPIHWAKHPTKCLDVADGNTQNGANLQIWSCKSMEENPNMQFLIPSVQGTIRWVGQQKKWWKPWETLSDKCIDVSGGGTMSGTNIQMWDCDDQHPNMQFTVRKLL